MDFQTYIPLALRTARLFPTPRENLRHASLGMLTELGEFATNVKRIVCYDKAATPEMLANMKEEGGDTMWYVPLALMALGFDKLTTPQKSQLGALPSDLAELTIFLNAMQGGIAAQLASNYDEPTAGDRWTLMEMLSGVVHAMDKIALLIGTTGDEMRAENIAKLRLRFPTKFTVEDAEGRADKGGLSASES